MKIVTALTCATLLIAGSAFAADAAAPAAAAPATAAAPAAKKAPDACAQDANSKSLHGKARKKFLRSCRKGGAADSK